MMTPDEFDELIDDIARESGELAQMTEWGEGTHYTLLVFKAHEAQAKSEYRKLQALADEYKAAASAWHTKSDNALKDLANLREAMTTTEAR